MLKHLLFTAFFSLLPISELRGGIPFAYSQGIPLIPAAIFSIFCNALVAPLAFVFLTYFHKLFYKWQFYAKIFDRLIERAQKKVHNVVEKYGMLGIYIFVAIPFPLTGAWTGVLGAWILGLSKRKTIMAVSLGVITSGIIVSAIIFFGAKTFDFMIKDVHAF